MKTLLINTSDLEGGAARSAYRLLRGLKEQNLNTLMLVQNKIGDDWSVIGPKNNFEKGKGIFRPHIDKLPLLTYKNKKLTPWSPSWLPSNITWKIREINPEIVHLHWINGGFLPINTLKTINKPIVWTLHDSWPFTGGCHIPYDCKNYKTGCGNCPQLGSNSNYDISKRVYNKKESLWKDINLTIVTPSNWLADCARSSKLFKNKDIRVIPNGLDINVFRPIDKVVARELLNLPENKKLILFGAMHSTKDSNKGFNYLSGALRNLAEKKLPSDVELVVFGASEPKESQNLGFKINYLGRVNDDIKLSLLYSAADVFVAPSKQENLPNTIMESLACATPVVAFNIGGIPDLIDHLGNGYLARPYSIEDLSLGIETVLKKCEQSNSLGINGRKKVEENFDIKDISKRYIDLYTTIANNEKMKNK